MNHLIAVIPYHNGDVELARNLLLWVSELGGCKNHACLLGADSGTKMEERIELKKLAQDAFGHATSVVVAVGDFPTYQVATNRMFERLSNQIEQTCKWPFLWLEPDCVPMKKDWLDQLADGYASQPKRYFGPIIKTDATMIAPADIKEHLTMVSVYPVNAHTELAEFFKGDRAFDMASHEYLPPRATDTRLISHFWPPRDQLATFKAVRTEEDPINVLTPERIWPEAVLWHQDKSGTLIPILRERLIVPKDLSPDLKKLHPANKVK
jgi:hypothetical protein